MVEERRSGCFWFITIIGLIGSLLTIFSFLSGNITLPQLVRQLVTSTPLVEFVPSPILTRTPEIIATITSSPLPQQSIKVEENKNYKIEKIPNGKTGIEIRLNGLKGFPYEYQLAEVRTLSKDIAGNFCIADNYETFNINISSEGIGRENGLTEGLWILTLGGDIFWGYLSKNVVYDQSNPINGIIFPIQNGWTTIITISISKLVVGVLSTDNSNAVPGISVEIFGQKEDIAGKKGPDRELSGGDFGFLKITKSEGTSTFFLGPGVYLIHVYDPHPPFEDKYVYGIEMEPGQEKQILVNFP